MNYLCTKILIFLLLMLFATAFVNCSSSNGEDQRLPYEPDSLAVAYNNQAGEIASSAFLGLSPDSSIYDAIVLLDKAIAIDSLYAFAYSNMITMLSHLGEYELAIKQFELIEERGLAESETTFLHAMLYEKLGKTELADRKYQEILMQYQNKLSTSHDNLEHAMNRAMVLCFVKGKSACLEEVNALAKLHPEKESVLLLQDEIRGFERGKFISNFYPK